MRQAYLSSRAHSHCPQARTVLLTSIPHDMCTEKSLRIWGAFIPGGIQNIWIYRDTKVRVFCPVPYFIRLLSIQELNTAYFARLKACKDLEEAASKIIRLAVLENARREKIFAKELAERRENEHVLAFPETSPLSRPQQVRADSLPGAPVSLSGMIPNILSSKSHISTDLEQSDSTDSQYASQKSLLNELVPPSKRPSERRGLFGLWGVRLDKFHTLKVSAIFRMLLPCTHHSSG